jgi:hypothetical protein
MTGHTMIDDRGHRYGFLGCTELGGPETGIAPRIRADASWASRSPWPGDLVKRAIMTFSSVRRIAVVAAVVTAAGLLTMAGATGASQPQWRQLAVTNLACPISMLCSPPPVSCGTHTWQR